MATSNLAEVGLPDITLPDEVPLLGFPPSETPTTSMPSFPEFTLPDPSQVTPLSDDVETSDQRNVIQSDDTDESELLQGPEASANTLGEFKMCTICNIHLNSKVQADMHYAGKIHQKKLKQRALAESTDFNMDISTPVSSTNGAPGAAAVETKGISVRHCDVCGLTMTGLSQVQSHLMGNKHAKKLRQLAQKKKLEEAKEDGPSEETPSTPDAFYCKLCSKVCSSQAQLEQHFQGSKHKNVVAAAKTAPDNRFVIPPAANETPATPSSYVCPTCNVTTNSEQQYLQHCSGTAHKDKLRDRSSGGNVRHEPYPIYRGGPPGRGKHNNKMYSGPNTLTRGNRNGSFNSSRGGNYRGVGGRGRGGQFQGMNSAQYNSYNNADRMAHSFGGFGGRFDHTGNDMRWDNPPADYNP